MGSSLRLICCCAPKHCHGNVIAAYLKKQLKDPGGPRHGSIGVGDMPSKTNYEYDNESPEDIEFHQASCSVPLSPNEIAVIT
eukprot:549138-Karenia_brevis.AAC.1